MTTKFDELVKKGEMTERQAENLEAMQTALNVIENIGPHIERDREISTEEDLCQ